MDQLCTKRTLNNNKIKMKRPRLHEPIPVACSDPERLITRIEEKKKELEKSKLLCQRYQKTV